MNNFNIVIYKNSTLFNILDELNTIFDFKSKILIDDIDTLINFLNENPETLVLSSEKISNKINNLLIDKPIKLKTLVEKVNIIVSKSHYKSQSNYTLNDYLIDINSRFLIKGNDKLKLTQKEVELILYLKNSKKERTPQHLQMDIWKHSPEVETHTVETHIYRLRKKINEKFNDNNFIINNKIGYKLAN